MGPAALSIRYTLPRGASTARSRLAPSPTCSSSFASPARRRTRRKQIGPTSSWTPIIATIRVSRSEEHTSELQSRLHLVCRLLLEKKKKRKYHHNPTNLK